jgi:hypothetical protein
VAEGVGDTVGVVVEVAVGVVVGVVVTVAVVVAVGVLVFVGVGEAIFAAVQHTKASLVHVAPFVNVPVREFPPLSLAVVPVPSSSAHQR